MDKAQHTPGPWTHRRIGPKRGPVRLTDKTFVIVPQGGPAFAYLPEGRDDIQSANARLIALAPEMAASLREILGPPYGEPCPDCGQIGMHPVDVDTGMSCRGRAMQRARALLARLEG